MAATLASRRKDMSAVLQRAAGDKRYKILETTMKRHQYRADALIEVLHKAQELFGYLEDDTLLFIACGLKLPPSRVYGVATFYHFFTLKRGLRAAGTRPRARARPRAQHAGRQFLTPAS